MEPINYSAMLSPIQPVTAPLDQLQQAQTAVTQRALATATAQRQLHQQALGDAALQDALKNPTPQAYRNLMLLNPQGSAAIKNAYDAMDTETQRQTLQDLTAVHNYLDLGQPDKAALILQKHIDAAKKAGQDTSTYDSVLQTVQSDPRRAQVLAGSMLAGAVGGDKLAETLGRMGDEQRKQAGFPTDEALKQAQTAQAQAEADKIKNPPPKTAVNAQTGAYYNENAAPPEGAGLTANNGAMDGFVQQVLKSESGGNPVATNGASTATGAAQFLQGTWLPLIQQLHPELTQGKTEQQILDLRNNPRLAAEATAAYAQNNAQALGQAGLPVTATTLAMAHKLGPQGARAVLGAQTDAPLSSVLPPEVIKANPQLGKLTAGAYAKSLAGQFGNTPIDANPGDPNASGEDFLRTLPPARAGQIRAIANGDIPLPTGRAAASGAGQMLAQQVLQYDPTASSINLQARQSTRKAFTSGQYSQTVNSLNTFAGHVQKLDEAVDKLHNTPLSWVNGPAQWAGQTFGNKDTQKAVADFKTWSGLASNELVKVLRGTGGAEADIKYWQQQLGAASSPAALHQVVQSMAEAVQSRLDSLKDTYNQGMQSVDKPLPLVRPETKAILDRLGSGQRQADNGPPAQAIAMLKANPALAAQFDAKYGPGASQQYAGR